jgi:hypothetical protein
MKLSEKESNKLDSIGNKSQAKPRKTPMSGKGEQI